MTHMEIKDLHVAIVFSPIGGPKFKRFCKNKMYAFSLNWPPGRFSLLVAMSVCYLFVCPLLETPLLRELKTSGQRVYHKLRKKYFQKFSLNFLGFEKI